MFDVDQLIRSGGILLISLIIFAESGLLIGFFLPGDTLLFGAGLAASQGELSLPVLILAIIAAAVIGDNVGYSIGKRMGSKLFTKEDGILFRKEYIETSEKFYEKHGGKTIIIARFTPIVRTFAPVVAGASNMSHRRFFMFNVIGGILWGAGMPLLGYFVGNRIPGLDKYMEIVILGVVVISILVAFGHILKDKKTRQVLKDKARHHARKALSWKKSQ
jgi:membrane-associated protein